MKRRESFVSSLRRSLAGGLSELWRYNLAKLGLAILAFILIMSVYAFAVLPSDFPAMWKNPSEPPWILYPRNAMPSWARYFTSEIAETKFESPAAQGSRLILTPTDFTALAPETARAVKAVVPTIVGYGEVRRVSYTLRAPVYPEDIVVVVRLDSKEINTTNIRAFIYVYLTRPDGTVFLVSEAKRFARELDIRNPIKLDPDKFSLLFYEYYRANMSVSQLQSLGSRLAFAAVSPGGTELRPYPGEYQITVITIFAEPGADPRNIKRLFDNGELRTSVDVIVKGNVFGLLGTDNMGRDLFMGLLFGFPVALIIGVSVSFALVVIGLVLGVISGYFGGRIDELIQRVVDVIANVPLLPVLILIGAIVQTKGLVGWPALIIIMTFLVAFSWGGVAIISRSIALSIKSEAYVEAARALGASSFRIVFRHILPQLVPYAMAALVFGVPGAIVAEAGLSVLGIDHGLPTWGRILADAQRERGISYNMWWWILPPGIMLGLFSFAFVAIGFALETIVEPRLRRR